MDEFIRRWKWTADNVAALFTDEAMRPTPDDLRTIAVVAALILVAAKLADVEEAIEMDPRRA